MTPISNYKSFIRDLIRKHMLVFGPNIAQDIALGISGLAIDTTGDVVELKGSPQLILQDLVSAYMKLSSSVTQLLVYELFSTYPMVEAEYTQPLERVKLVCALTDGSSS